MMRKEIYTEININSSPEEVWSVLTRFDDYSNWNPFIRSISGTPEKGGKLKALIQPMNGKAMTFKTKVLKYNVNDELRWTGSLVFPFIFRGEHFFQVRKNDQGGTTFRHGENFSGILVGLLDKMLEQTKEGFELMNMALKQKCEESIL